MNTSCDAAKRYMVFYGQDTKNITISLERNCENVFADHSVYALKVYRRNKLCDTK